MAQKVRKVVVVGDSKAGKSSLVQYYTNGYFSFKGLSTSLSDFPEKHVHDNYVMRVWDTKGGDAYSFLRTSCYTNANAILVVYDVTNRRSFEHLDGWLHELNHIGVADSHLVLVANKVDHGENRQVSRSEGRAYAFANRMAYFETSVYDGRSISPPFESVIDHDRYIKAMTTVLRKGASAPWMRSKLMVVGKGQVGKTATVNTLTGETFSPLTESTIGASITQTQVLTGPRGKVLKVASGNIQEHATQMAARVAEKRMKEEGVKKRQALASNNTPETTKPQAPPAEVQDDRKEDHEFPPLMDSGALKRKLILTSKDRQNDLSLTIWDYGGQTVFYTLHHLFLTKYGVYMLVFDMRDFIGNADLDLSYLRYWLSSIRLHAPDAPVLLVGTFRDVVSTSAGLKEVESRLRNSLRERDLPQIVRNDKESLLFYPLDNTTARGLGAILRTVESATREQNYIQREVSLRWLRALDIMLETEAPWLSIQVCTLICRDLGILSLSEVESMLSLFNELGVIVYLSGVGDIVTTDAQWLVDCLGKVIRDSSHGFNKRLVERSGLTEDVATFFDKAIISRDLLEFLWEREQVEFLIEFMRCNFLLSTYGFGTTEELYLVPSLLPNTAELDEPRGLSFVVDFQVDLPTGVFQRVLCLCISQSESSKENQQEPILSSSNAKFWLGSDSCWMMQADTAEIRCTAETADAAPVLLGIVRSVLKNINSNLFEDRLRFNVKLATEAGEYKELAQAQREGLEPWFREFTDRQAELDLSWFIQRDMTT